MKKYLLTACAVLALTMGASASHALTLKAPVGNAECIEVNKNSGQCTMTHCSLTKGKAACERYSYNLLGGCPDSQVQCNKDSDAYSCFCAGH